MFCTICSSLHPIRPINQISYAGIVVASILLLASSLLTAQQSAAQIPGDAELLQIGLGVLPGAGLQLGYVDQKRMYTRDAVFYGHVQPGIFENGGSVQASATIGFSLRVIGMLETINAIDERRYDIDIGARLGPGLTFAFDETPLQKNQRFSLTLEPVLRLARGINKYRYYIETGIVRPSVRFGILARL